MSNHYIHPEPHRQVKLPATCWGGDAADEPFWASHIASYHYSTGMLEECRWYENGVECLAWVCWAHEAPPVENDYRHVGYRRSLSEAVALINAESHTLRMEALAA